MDRNKYVEIKKWHVERKKDKEKKTTIVNKLPIARTVIGKYFAINRLL